MNRPSPVHIAALATASPPFSASQPLAGETLLRHAAGKLRPRSVSLSRKLFAHPSIRKRHFAIDSPEVFFAEDPELVRRVFRSACQFVEDVPVRRLTFVPDARVWELIT